ncbi:MAG: ABC transporter permease [Nitrospirota bacterium]|nr:ABC transporter permease [Nitrospirota bacterium]
MTSRADTETVISPATGVHPFRFSELWSFRELLLQLVWRDVSVRYKQTALGLMWAVLNPVLMAVIFSIIFGIWARMPSGDIPYPLFFLAGIIPWTFFASALADVSNSLVSQRALLTKVYFPRVITPLAATAVPLVDALVAILVLLAATLLKGMVPSWHALWAVPLGLVWAWVSALGVGLCFSALNIKYRDVGQLVPFIVRVGMFASPVIYPLSMIPEKWQWLYGLNPVVGVIELTRWSMFSTVTPPNPALYGSVGISLFFLVLGAYMFRRMEATYADLV